jgi:hypothetical protein
MEITAARSVSVEVQSRQMSQAGLAVAGIAAPPDETSPLDRAPHAP